MRSSSRSDAPPRFATPRSPDRPTLGEAVARVGALLGAPPLAWQRLVMDTALELDPDGRPAYREVRVTVPRQQGKTGGLVLPVIVHRALGGVDGRAQRILYTAQDRNHAREKWSEQVELLDRSPLRRLYTVRRSNGSESIRWRTGSTHGITASGEKSGHGFTLDLGVIDEAFAQVDDRLVQAFRPAMLTRPWAQLWVVSTAGTDESAFLRERVDDGRARVEAGERTGVAYFEWSAPDDADPDDPATWRAAMPALGTLIDEETVAADHAAMDSGEFARAYLNRWSPGGVPVFSLAEWVACHDPSSGSSSGARVRRRREPGPRARVDRGRGGSERRPDTPRGRRPATGDRLDRRPRRRAPRAARSGRGRARSLRTGRTRSRPTSRGYPAFLRSSS